MRACGFAGAAALIFLSTPVFAEGVGSGWQVIYQNDFANMNFTAGTSRNRLCVEEAFKKAAEVRAKGGTVGSLIHLDEAVQLVAKTYDDKQLVIACSAQGVLAIFYNSPDSLAAVFDSLGAMKPELKVQPADTSKATEPTKAEPAKAAAPAQ